MFDWATIAKVLEIGWINILLSGDNAVVIALACRALPVGQRKMGVLLGAGVAVVLRIAFAFIVATLMGLPFLRIVGALLLLWIAVKLVTDDAGEAEVAAHDSLWKAVQTIAIADAVMSLDNVIAVAAVAKGDYWLFIFGLALSIPIVVLGAQLIMSLLTRFPILVWAGAALLGWVAGEMIFGDPMLLDWMQARWPQSIHLVPAEVNPAGREAIALIEYSAAAIGAALVVLIALVLRGRGDHEKAA
ncbi:MAG: hypothetical protein BGP06_17305 [Rhizobiales bacterium 65-9]|nr:MAG: hypothetical protein BGP06_17305 [Rhizobiales bacterium 65-9]